MSHELTMRNDGTAEMAYVGNVPWHGLGQELQPGASIEEWQRAAGMDWRILRAIVRYNTARPVDGQTTEEFESAFQTVDDKRVLFRSDTLKDLGIVSGSYNVVQPGAVLEFFRDLVSAAGFQLTTAGTLFGGRRFWALASIGQEAFVADKRDAVKGNLLLCTSADGTLATEGRFTDICVVCNNTLTASRGQGEAKTRTTHRTVFRPDEIKAKLGVARDQFDSRVALYRALAEKSLSPQDAAMLTCELFNPAARDLARDALRKLAESKPVERIASLAINGEQIGGGLAGRSGTAWGWLNAVTQYVDHEARARNQDNRMNSAWFGKGDALKTRAFELITADGETVTEYRPVPADATGEEGADDFARLLGRPLT